MTEKTMRAAVLHAFNEPLSIDTLPLPEPGPGEALVRVRASGLCLTDAHIQDGIIASVKPPNIPGHEMAGEVAAIGAGVDGLSVGQHVVCAIDITCGECDLCRMGRENLCRNRVRIGFERNGSHAEYALAPAKNLIPVREDIPFEQVAILPDAVACMLHAIRNQGQVKRGTKVLLYGVGGLGLQGVQIAKHLGAEVYASARTDAKLEKALEFGADAVINTRRQDLPMEIKRLTEGKGCDVIFDLVGTAESINRLLPCLRPGGKIVAVAYADQSFVMNAQEIVIKEKEIVGIRGTTTETLMDAVRMVEDGILTPYVSKRYKLEEINEALADLRESRMLGRSVITFD